MSYGKEYDPWDYDVRSPIEQLFDKTWFRALLLVVSLLWMLFWALAVQAADLKPKAVYKAAPPPVIQNYSFYVGAFGGAGLTSGVNQFSAFVDGEPVAISNAAGFAKGFPTSPFAGMTVGYTQYLGSLLIDFSADGAYVFSRGCVTIDCTTARKDGLLMEQGLGIGLNLANLNGLQPIPLPSPSGVPSSVWSSLVLMARGGAEERTLNLCQFAVTGMLPDGELSGSNICGSKIIAAPFAGTEFVVQPTPQTAFFAKWSHVWWGNQYQLAIDTSAISPIFTSSSLQKIEHEDIFRVGFKYYLF